MNSPLDQLLAAMQKDQAPGWTPPTPSELRAVATLFDRPYTFAKGDIVQKRSDLADLDSSGSLPQVCNMAYPKRGQRAIVVDLLTTSEPSPEGAGFNNKVLVVLCKVDENKYVRFAIDPIFYEKVPAEDL